MLIGLGSGSHVPSSGLKVELPLLEPHGLTGRKKRYKGEDAKSPKISPTSNIANEC